MRRCAATDRVNIMLFVQYYKTKKEIEPLPLDTLKQLANKQHKLNIELSKGVQRLVKLFEAYSISLLGEDSQFIKDSQEMISWQNPQLPASDAEARLKQLCTLPGKYNLTEIGRAHV